MPVQHQERQQHPRPGPRQPAGPRAAQPPIASAGASARRTLLRSARSGGHRRGRSQASARRTRRSSRAPLRCAGARGRHRRRGAHAAARDGYRRRRSRRGRVPSAPAAPPGPPRPRRARFRTCAAAHAVPGRHSGSSAVVAKIVRSPAAVRRCPRVGPFATMNSAWLSVSGRSVSR